jgi:hypothetical protein
MGLDAKVIRPEDNMIVNHGVLLGLVEKTHAASR